MKLKTKNMAKQNYLNLRTILVLSAIFWGCKPHVSIEQDDSLRRYCDDTHYVSTKVRVQSWYGLTLSLESWQQEVVSGDKIKEEYKRQKDSALTLKAKIENCIK